MDNIGIGFLKTWMPQTLLRVLERLKIQRKIHPNPNQDKHQNTFYFLLIFFQNIQK